MNTLSQSQQFESNRKGMLTIKRDWKFVGAIVPMEIYIDGEYMERVDNGKTVTVSVAPGEHKVYVSSSMMVRSSPLILQLEAGQTIRLNCGYTFPMGAYLKNVQRQTRH